VLYDDGELTYSVDEYPDTIPQAVIDMNNVLEVADAEDITGNQFAIAITANEKVHFVKGTSKEEKKWYRFLLIIPFFHFFFYYKFLTQTFSHSFLHLYCGLIINLYQNSVLSNLMQ